MGVKRWWGSHPYSSPFPQLAVSFLGSEPGHVMASTLRPYLGCQASPFDPHNQLKSDRAPGKQKDTIFSPIQSPSSASLWGLRKSGKHSRTSRGGRRKGEPEAQTPDGHREPRVVLQTPEVTRLPQAGRAAWE